MARNGQGTGFFFPTVKSTVKCIIGHWILTWIRVAPVLNSIISSSWYPIINSRIISTRFLNRIPWTTIYGVPHDIWRGSIMTIWIFWWRFGKQGFIGVKDPRYAAAAAASPQSCPTLCDPIDGSPSGSPIPGILQPRTLEWVAISFSNAWKWKGKVKSLSRVQL